MKRIAITLEEAVLNPEEQQASEHDACSDSDEIVMEGSKHDIAY